MLSVLRTHRISHYLPAFPRLIFVVCAGMLFFAPTFTASAATLLLSPSSGSHSAGSTFSVTVIADGGGQQMNAIQAELSFDANTLAVTNISQANTMSLWTEEPTYSNTAGTISFGGGNPTPFSGRQNIITITFRAASEGTASVNFASGMITAADGQGTDIYSGSTPGSYQITAAAEPEPEPDPAPTPAPTSTGRTPPAPLISSSTHEDEDMWYSETTARFSWGSPSGVTASRLLITREAEATPTVVHEPAVSEREIEDLEEGVWYFHVQLRNAAGWGNIGTMRIQIDATPPEPFVVTEAGEPGSATPTLEFETTDELSGLDRYVITIEGREPIVVMPDDLENGSYTFESALPMGVHDVTVTAYDRANNSTEAHTQLDVTEEGDVGRSSPVAFEDEGPSFLEQYGNALLITILLLIIASLLGFIWYQNRSFNKTRNTGSKETKEIRIEMQKIFSALKEEGEELLTELSGKKKLSAKEKDALDRLRNAIDISEELMDKEISDVEKLLKDY